jgi:aminoglycoside phosphotransferase (APT) family kinase protein
LTINGRLIVGETLRVLRADMDSRVAPDLSDPDASLAARMISDLLAYLAMWHLDLPEDLSHHIAARAALVERPYEDEGLPGDLPVEGPAYGRLAGALQQRIEDENGLDPCFLAAVAAADSALYADETRRLERGARVPRERLERVEVEATPERAQALVTALLGAGRTVTSLSRVPGGMSKDSFFLDTREPDGAELRLMIRRDLPWGPAQTTVLDEYARLTRLFELGLPIAEPLGCDATRILGQPAMLSRRVAGRSGTAPWDADPESRRTVCLQLAAVMARLHRVDPAAVGMPPASSDPREQVRAYVIEWRDRWRRNRVHASPTLAAAFAWLLGNIPAEIDGPAIVHGDIGFHNAIVDDEQLVALLDWEFAHVGDPTEDLSYCRQFVEGLLPWEDFVAGYRAAGGGEYRAENARFFELWRSVRNAITCSVAWRGFLDGSYPALKMASQGISAYRYFIRNTAETLKERLA